MARHTAETYLHDLCQTGLLMRTERGYELTRTDIFDPGQLSAEERLRLFPPPEAGRYATRALKDHVQLNQSLIPAHPDRGIYIM